MTTGSLTVDRGGLADAIIECKRRAPKDDQYLITIEGGHEWRCGWPGVMFKEVWYGGDFEFKVSEVLSAAIDDGTKEGKNIPVWGMDARGWYVKSGKKNTPSPQRVASVLGAVLRNPPRSFPCRGSIAPKGMAVEGYPGFVYFNRLNPHSSAKKFFAEGAGEIHYKGNKVYREKWRYGLLRVREASIVLVGETPREIKRS